VTRIEVVRRGELQRGDSTRGIVRERAFEAEEVLFGQSKIAIRTQSGWHHHGTRHLYGYIVSGRLRFDFLQTKIESTEISPGTFFHIPVGLIHRDVNPDQTMEAVVVNILLGKGPAVVNVPDPSA
jgi:uncharacterized RmlC-like cupin family protein